MRLFFHEEYPRIVTSVIAVWAAFQTATYVLDEHFREDVFWNTFSLVGYFLFYLILGVIWSFTKLYLNILFKHLPTKELLVLDKCFGDNGSDKCAVSFLFTIKWRIVRTMIVWPISILHTLSKDPLRIITDLVFQTLSKYYVQVLRSAVQAQHNNIQPEASWFHIGLTTFYILIYLLVGYIWTHLKLYIDVWQGSLPKHLDEQVKTAYSHHKNYFSFLLHVKYLVIQWTIFWPFSMLYTICRHPLKIAVDVIYEFSERKYNWIVQTAMQTRMKNKNE